jgi:hypothetical protein
MSRPGEVRRIVEEQSGDGTAASLARLDEERICFAPFYAARR